MSTQTANSELALHELGHFGRYQLIIFTLILIPIAFSAVYNSQYIFSAADVDKRYQLKTLTFVLLGVFWYGTLSTQYVFNAMDTKHRCMVPECETWPPQFATNGWGAWAFPEGGSSCKRMQPIGSDCSASSFHNTKTVPCDHWVYENNNSIVSEFNLGCEEWKRTTVGTIHSAGIFMALPLTAYISDTFGRRVAFIVTGVSPAFAGLIRSFSPNYIFYICFEFIDAMVGAGVYTTGFVLAQEMVGKNRRVLCGNIMSCTFALGQALVAVIAWRVPYWRHLTRVLYTPSFLFILYYFFIEESVRWLISKGNRKEAARIIFKAAAINKRKLSPELIKELTEQPREDPKPVDAAVNSTADKSTSIMLQVLKSKVLMCRLCICAFWWITVTFIYYGLSINSVSLAGNSYVNYILTSLIEIPGYILSVLTLDRFGRKRSIIVAYFVCGMSLIGLPFIPPTMEWLQTSLNLFGKLCISMVFSSIYVYTGELFPTRLRHRMMAACSMAGRIGQMVAPQTPLLMTYMTSLPYLLFGVMSACAGLLMMLTPETLRASLPDTIQQAETISAKKTKPVTVTVN